MDWAKAKTILIFIFLILNIFLLSTILYTNSARFASNYTKYAIDYLHSRNISIKTSVPNISGKIGKIFYTGSNFDLEKLTKHVFGHKVSPSGENGHVIIKEGEEKIEIVNDKLFITDKLGNGAELFADSKDFLQMVYKYLNDLGFSKKNLSLRSQDESADRKLVTLVIKNKNALLFDQIITVALNKEGILTLTIPGKVAKRANAPAEIISACQVLVMAGLPDGSVIKKVDFGYKKVNDDEFYDTPVWGVVLEDYKTIFYNAYTGEELQ